MFSSLVPVLAFFAAALLADEVLKRTPLVRLDERAGHTVFGGFVFVSFLGAALFAVLFTVMPLVNAHVAWSTGDDYPFVLGVAVVLAIISLLVGWCWLRTKWKWDEEGISAFQGLTETRLAWDEIRDVEISPWTSKVSGYGREIVWTRYTLGYKVLRDALRSRRPDLAESTK
jgi:hypothetical protein